MILNNLTVADRFCIFEQLNLRQRSIDNGWGRDQAETYCLLYWPESKVSINDLRNTSLRAS